MNIKIKFCKLRKNSSKLEATVIEYRREKGSMRNDYTKLNYPYVRILGGDGRIVKLRYADNSSKPFKLGETIEVFWSNGELMYWQAFEKGFYKYLPETWNIFNL